MEKLGKKNPKNVEKQHKILIKTLKSEGKYTPLLDIQAWHSAVLLSVCQDMADRIMSGEEDYIEVSVSREGNERYKQSTFYQLFAQYMDRLQDSLKALGMNIDSKPTKPKERGISDFLDSFKDAQI